MGFYTVATHVKSYPLEISLAETDEEIIRDYQVKLEKAFSVKYQMKTVIDFTHPEKPDDPFYSLLFDNGDCFLVDDSEWEEKEEFIILEFWSL